MKIAGGKWQVRNPQLAVFRIASGNDTTAGDRTLQAAVAAGNPVRLRVDGSKVGHGHQLLMVVLRYRRRAIPWRGPCPAPKRATTCYA